MYNDKLTIGIAAAIVGLGIILIDRPASNAPITAPAAYSTPVPEINPPHHLTFLTDADRSYLIAVTAASMMVQQCNGTLDVDGAVRFGHRIGADIIPLNNAAGATVAATIGKPYEQRDMISGVPEILAQTIREILTGLELDRTSTCLKWTSQLKSFGVLK
jgi:hypothetical protein